MSDYRHSMWFSGACVYDTNFKLTYLYTKGVTAKQCTSFIRLDMNDLFINWVYEGLHITFHINKNHMNYETSICHAHHSYSYVCKVTHKNKPQLQIKIWNILLSLNGLFKKIKK